MKFIPYGHQSITQEDIEAVVDVLKSDYLTQGPAVEKFESDFSKVVKAPYAIACANGTAGLHLAVLAAKIGAGDRVLTTPITFAASANCAKYVGSDVDFADIDPKYITLSPVAAEEALFEAQKNGKPFKALITVDLGGHPCNMTEFARLKEKYNLIWIQDACHALGAAWTDSDGRKYKIGEWAVPDMTVFSFHPVKHITTAEGGMITTHDKKYAEHLKILRTHGISKDPNSFTRKDEAFDLDGKMNPWYYEVQELGFNYRLTDMQAALGSSQLKRLDASIKRRNQIVAFYRGSLRNLDSIVFPSVAPGVLHAHHLAIVRIDFERQKISRAQAMHVLHDRSVGTQVHYIPVPLMPLYGNGKIMHHLPNAMRYYREALSLPCFPTLTDADLDLITSSLKDLLA